MPLPPSTASMAVLRATIRDALVAKLVAAQTAGQALEDVKTVTKARSGEVGIALPCLWVDSQPHQPEARGGHTVTHPFTFDVWAMVENYDDPQDGEAAADDLLARAYDVVMSGGRTLNGTVHDVMCVQYDVPVGSEEKGTIYLARFRVACQRDRRE